MKIDKKIDELWKSFPKLRYSTISGYDKGLIINFMQDEKKKWKEEVMKELGLNTYTVGIASARREDLGTPKADPESEYNKGYRDATNKMNEWLRVKLEEV